MDSSINGVFILDIGFMRRSFHRFCSHTMNFLWTGPHAASRHVWWGCDYRHCIDMFGIQTFTDCPSHSFGIKGCLWCFTPFCMIMMKRWCMLASTLVQIVCKSEVGCCDVPRLIHGIPFWALQTEVTTMTFGYVQAVLLDECGQLGKLPTFGPF